MTHRDIISERGGVTEIARIAGAHPNTVKQWRRSDSIPAPYWRALADEGVATLEELAEAAARRKAAA